MNNFDHQLDRKNTSSVKYDFSAHGFSENTVPMWVADMDFQSPESVMQALHQRVDHGIFGYTEMREEYIKTLRGWFADRFDWSFDDSWLVKTPGIVFALCMAIRAITNEGDAVLIQEPVYYPFKESIVKNDRSVVINQLAFEEGLYQVDFADFEQKIIDHNVKLFILCSPHNPVGRVWKQEELIEMGNICLNHGVRVISDEIHADIVYPGNTHYMFAKLKPEFLDISVTCTSPSKSFNIAGLHTSNIFIKDAAMRKSFIEEIMKTGTFGDNIMGYTACQAAYDGGQGWLEELKGYLWDNVNYVRTFLQEHLPQIKMIEPQGTYLLWLDCSALGLNDKSLNQFMIEEAGLWLDGGTMFGSGGEGFQRFNIACPRTTLERAFGQLERAVKTYIAR